MHSFGSYQTLTSIRLVRLLCDNLAQSVIVSVLYLYLHLYLYFYCTCSCICVFALVFVLDSASYRARSICCDTRTIRLGASPRKPDTSPGTLGRNSNLALALLAPAQLAHLGFGSADASVKSLR